MGQSHPADEAAAYPSALSMGGREISLDPARLAEDAAAHRSTLSMGGQEVTRDSTRTMRREERDGVAVLVIESRAETPMGSTADTYVLDAGSLRPLSRFAIQGPARVEVTYGDGRVTGSIQAGPQEIAIDQELEAPVFGGDAALDAVVAALPLADGYETLLRSFEVGLQQRRTRLWSLEVAGSETVEVPAGSFETFRVVLEALDGEGGGQTLWLTRETPRLVVKSEGKRPPQMGQGTVTSVLTAIGEDVVVPR